MKSTLPEVRSHGLFFGDTPIKSFKKYGEAGIEFVDDMTGLEIDKRFAPFYAVAGIALDLSGTGKGAKTIFKSLHNAKTLEEASGVMRTAGFDDGIIKDYAPIFAKTTVKEETSKALEAALKLQKETKMVKNVNAFGEVSPLEKSLRRVSVKSDDTATIFKRRIRSVKKEEISKGITTDDYLDQLSHAHPSASRLAHEADEGLNAKASIGLQRRFDRLSPGDQDVFFEMKALLAKLSDEDVVAAKRAAEDAIEGKRTVRVNVTDETVFMDAVAKDPELKELTQKYPEVSRVAQMSEDNPATQRAFDKFSDEEKDVFLEIKGRTMDVSEQAPYPVKNLYKKTDSPLPARTYSVNDPAYIKIAEKYPAVVRVSNMAPESKEMEDAFNLLSAREKDAFFELETIKDWSLLKKSDIPVKPELVDDVPINPVKEGLGPVGQSLNSIYGKGTVTKSNVARVRIVEEGLVESLDEYILHTSEGTPFKSPGWVSPHLGTPKTIGRLSDILSSGNVPTVIGSPELELYNEMTQEVVKRAGIKAVPIHNNAPQRILQSHHEMMWEPYGTQPAFPSNKGLQKKMPVEEQKMLEADKYDEYVETKEAKLPEVKKEAETAFDKFKKVVPWRDLKDVSGGLKHKKDIYSYSREVFGAHWDEVKYVFEKFDVARGKRIDDKDRMKADLQKDIMEKYGIKPGSKESWDIVFLGEEKITMKELVAKRGIIKARNIEEATKWMRTHYDEMIIESNARNKKLFPNDEWRQIDRRTNYFHHGEKLSALGAGLDNLMEGIGLDRIGTNSISEAIDTVAQKAWVPFIKPRRGLENEFDALTGYARYVDYYTYAKVIDPEIVRMNRFVKFLADQTGTKGNLNNYIAELESWIADLAGRTNPADNAIRQSGKYLSGTLTLLDYMNKKAKVNAIIGNVSSNLSQAMNAPFHLASSGPVNYARGITQYGADLFHTFMPKKMKGYHPLWEKSIFIKERMDNFKIYDKFNRGTIEHSKQFLGFFLGALDIATNKIGYNALITKAIRRGHPNPVAWADQEIRSIVGDRGVGGTALMQKAKVFQILAPFQVEVTQQFIKQWDIAAKRALSPTDKLMVDSRFKYFMNLYIGVYAMDMAYESLRGEGGFMNPIQALVDSYELYETDTLTAKEKAIQVPGRLVGELVGGVPIIGNMGSSLIFNLLGQEEALKAATGDGDPTRLGSKPLLLNALNISEKEGGVMNLLYSVGLPFGGKQAEKTVQGVDAVFRGEVVDWEGKPVADLKPGAWGALQNAAFGKWQPNLHYEKVMADEMKDLFYINRALNEQGKVDEVKANLKALTPEVLDIYEKVDAEQKAEIVATRVKGIRSVATQLDGIAREQKRVLIEAGETKDEEKKKELKAKAAVYYDVSMEILNGLSETEIDHLDEHRTREYEAKADERAEDRDNPETRLKNAIDFLYAFGTNPKQTIAIIKNNEMVEDTIGGSFGGLVRPRRIPVAKSEEIKKRMAIEKGVDPDDYELGHILPRALGGSYAETNLVLETPEQNKAWVIMETYLVDAVKTKTIGYKEAQELILQYKGADGRAFITAEEIKKKVGVDKFKDEDFDYLEQFEEHRGIDDWGRNSWPLSDADNTNRNDNHRRRLKDVLLGNPTNP